MTQGFTVLRGVFHPHEVQSIRQELERFISPEPEGDLLTHPSTIVQDLVTDSRIINIAKTILGKKVIYFGDSGFTIGGLSHGWHKDNADRYDNKAPDWQGEHNIIRIGIYLQDHVKHSGGLNLRRKSHLTSDHSTGTVIYAKTALGDVVVWNLRITHSGNGKLISWLPSSIQLDPELADRLPKQIFAPFNAVERLGIFMTFAAEGRHLERLIQQYKSRSYIIRIWSNMNWSQQSRDVALRNGLILRNVWDEVCNDSNLGWAEGYQPIPY